MAEAEYIGVARRFNEEEQKAYDQYFAEHTGQSTSDLEPAGGGYYAGQMGDEGNAEFGMAGGAAGAEPVTEPQPSTHWIANPANFAEVWTKFDQDPNYEDEHYSREQIDTLYDYYSYKNQGKPMNQWAPLMDNDEFVTKEIEKNNWYDPVREEKIAEAAENNNWITEIYNPSDPKKQAFLQKREVGDWNNLDWIGKLGAAVTTTDEGLKNEPGYVKKTQAGAQALSSAMSGAVALKLLGDAASLAGASGLAAALTNPYVLAGAAVAVGGLVFYQAVTGKEIPYFNKFLELSDIVDTTVEHVGGFGAQTYGIAKGNIEKANADPNDSYNLLNAVNDTLTEVFTNAGSMWKAGEYFYEMEGSIGDFAIDALKEIFKGEEGTKAGEAWFFNRGINEKQQLAEGTYGLEGLENIREMYAEMDKMGVDKDIQDQIMQQAVINASGTSGNVSDYVAQMLIDLDFLTPTVENNTAMFFSKITGNELGIEAAKNNRGSIITQVPVVGPLVQSLSGGNVKAPGGFNEWFDNYRNLARSTDVSKLTTADRFFGGITEDGTLKDFARTEKTGPADLLPESKVAGVGNIAQNTLNAYMDDVRNVSDLRNRLSALAGDADPNRADLAEINNSADVRTVRDGFRHAIAETNPEMAIRQFEASEGARNTLAGVADALGMQVKDVLSLYSETPEVFEQRVRQYAAQHNGLIAGVDVTNGVDPVSQVVKGFTVAKDGKGAPMAWDIRQLQYQVTTGLIDSMAQYYTDYYGVKPNSTINMVFDTMKSAQSLLLLGWSPSYFINNVINNAVTSAAEGVLGFMTPKQINQWMDAFGVKPARFDVDTSSEFRGQNVKGKAEGLEAFSSAAAEAKKAGSDQGAKRILSEVNKLLKNANDKLGVFSNLSGLMETYQGNQLTTVAIQQYWRNRWKRGEGFHLMPDALVATIEAQNPGFTNVIYQAIENGLNMDQVRKVLFDTYVKPDAGTVMKAIVSDMFKGEAQVFEEVFEKSGIMNDLTEKIRNCTTDEERQTVIDEAVRKLDDYLANLRREDLITRANDTATVVENEGLAPVAQMMSEMAMNRADFWQRSRNEWTEVKEKIRTENMDSKAARAIQADLVARQNKAWADFYKQEITTAAGIMKGLGFQNEAHAKYIGLMVENNKNWQGFNTAKSRELQRYYDRCEAIRNAAGKGKKADSVQLSEAWEDFNIAVSELYDQHFAREQELQTKMDAAFVEGYEFSTGKSGEQFRQNFARIAEIRQRMHDMQQEAHRKTKDMNREEQAEFYAEYNPKYNALIREIGNIGDANAQLITQVSEEGPGIENRTPVKMTPEETVAAAEVMDTNNQIRETAMRERRGYLDRDGIREGWIEAGRTPAEADLMMAVFDAAAQSWAKMNGMYPDEFYSEAAKLKEISRWLPGVSNAEGGMRNAELGVLKQTTIEYTRKYHKIIMNHYGNENFRKWFGIGTDHESKVVNEYGMPLVVHHGTNAEFDTFRLDMLGTNTIAESAKMGIFFTDSEHTAESYTNTAEEKMMQYLLIGALDFDDANIDKTYTAEERTQLLQRYKELYEFAEEQWEEDRYSININHLYREIDDKYLGSFAKYLLPPESYIQFEDQLETRYIEASIAGLQNLLNHTDDLYDGKVMDTYLYIQNPLVYDYHGESWNDATHVRIIQQAKAEGYDGVIFKNVIDQTGKGGEIFASQTSPSTVYCVFDPHQIKSIENDGTFNKLDPNILHQQAVDMVKGTFEHTEAGNIIRMLEASDVSTMVHESGHLFRRTLSTPLLTEFTQWAGFESVAEFQELEARWNRNDPTLTEAERQRYVDAEEKFARGFEQYLMDGSAPTAGLKAVFKAFRDYLLDIYKNVKAAITGNDYSKQGEFIFHGQNGDEVLNINAKINGVRLADIFDRMLTDDVQRIPGYQEIVTNHRTELSQDRHNMRMSANALSRRAQVEVTRTILQHFGSMEEAEAALANYDLPLEINGWRVDDGTLFEAIQAAKADEQMNPFAEAQWHEVKGTITFAHSNIGNGKYQMQYKVVELNDLVPSNLWFGDQLVINEDYPGDVQARKREENLSNVYAHAVNLNPGKLIDEFLSIDRGAPIVGEGNLFVESGNGRVLSLLYARDHYPEQWAGYQEYLRNSIDNYGIDPSELDGFENPVLIRERMGGDSISFAEDANTDTSESMTASENALTDANKFDMHSLGLLDIVPGEGVDTFETEKNAQITVDWLRSLPEVDFKKYSATNRNGELVLSVEGKNRFINALFATLYATRDSMDIIRSFSETNDSTITALESALKQSLPEMARAEGLIRDGSRDASLSITADVMAAAGLLQEARKTGINIHDYLAQQTIPGLERWTPTQALLAGFFGDAKNNVKKIRDFFNAYGEEVYKASDPNQLALFTETRTREQMINDSLDVALGKKTNAESGIRNAELGAETVKGQGPEDGGREAVTVPQGVTVPDGPALFQSVMDSEGKWSQEFAKVLNENKQRTFDDGMSVPLEEADQVYLRGETNAKYETMVQRLLRDFSNDKNLSPDQYLYAWEYMDWWCQGANGEAPKGNPIWESQIQKMVMNDFTYAHPDLVSELKRRFKKGAEVDPVAVPNKGEFVKRVYHFEHGFWNVAGNVYKDGKLVAFLPEELDRMKKTIEVDGQQYHVLGVDMNDPEGLVYYDPMLEIVRTVVAGKPEGFDEPRNPFMFIKPGRQGTTPQTMPVAEAYTDLAEKYIKPALRAFQDKYREADADARTAKMTGLNADTRIAIENWLNSDVAADMRTEKYRAVKYADMKKDAAMLNYNQRYGFDPILTMLSPYQFWYTRSMWKWAKRMIDKPSLGNAYERMKEYEDRNRQENLPSRLSGRWRIPMPFLPDWMGGSYYIDLNSQLFPFAQFGQNSYSNLNERTVNARTEEILSQMVEGGMITEAEMLEAKEKKSGTVWANAKAEAEVEIGKNDGLSTLASQFISPNIFFSWYQKVKNGEDPGTLSATRTGNAIRALTSDIPLVSKAGSIIGDAMALPEKALRKLYGIEYNEFGALGDQYIRKQISQMCADGEITWRQALNAMNEKKGTIWDMAAERQRKEAMLKVPGAAGLEGVKQFITGNGSFGDAIGGLAVSMLGGGNIFPTGEKTLREQKTARDKAYELKAAGDTDALNRWGDENPEYVTRQATYINDPEELLKFTLYQNITDKYYDQPYAQQQEILNELGPEFYYALFNKETRNYKAVDVNKLAEWNARIGNQNPDVGTIDVKGVERVMQLSEPVIDAVTQYDTLKNQLFPGIKVIQDGYYALPKDQRKAYAAAFPQLDRYWDWNREYKNQHPEYVRWENERSAYYNEQTLYNTYGDMSQRTQKELELLAVNPKYELSDFGKYELQRLYQKYANPNFQSFEDYVTELSEWK